MLFEVLRRAGRRALSGAIALLYAAFHAVPHSAYAQGLPNLPRIPNELIADYSKPLVE
jgi:hypothetical protein